MSILTDIEGAVVELPPEELSIFRDWFAHFDAEQWDRQLEKDIVAGRLNALADVAIQELHRRKCSDKNNG